MIKMSGNIHQSVNYEEQMVCWNTFMWHLTAEYTKVLKMLKSG